MTKASNIGNINLQLQQPFGKGRSPLLNWPNKSNHHRQLEGQCTGKIVIYGNLIDGHRMGGRESKSLLVKETISLSGKDYEIVRNIFEGQFWEGGGGEEGQCLNEALNMQIVSLS